MFCASVAYSVQQGSIFNFEYFAKKHAPLFASYLGENCVGFEVHKSLASPGAPLPSLLGVAYFWVKPGENFGAKLAQYHNEIYSDIPKFTDIEPIRQWSAVVQSQAEV